MKTPTASPSALALRLLLGASLTGSGCSSKSTPTAAPPADGGCAAGCQTGLLCHDDRCVAERCSASSDCPSPLQCLAGFCASVDCDPPCQLQQSCLGGICLAKQPTTCAAPADCASPESCVGGYCADTGCEPPCGTAATCLGGVCVPQSSATTCGAPYSACAASGVAYCANLAQDPANCGACGAVCPSGQLCNGQGLCATSCLSAELDCGALCIDPQSDNLNCGQCGNACPAEQACSAGTCALSCGPGLSLCGVSPGLYCKNLQSDPFNCGSCGYVCGANRVCVSGACLAIGTPPGGAGDAGPTDAGPPTCLPSGTFDATHPAAAGYALVFSDDFTDAGTIDLNNTQQPGFNWYLKSFGTFDVFPDAGLTLLPDGGGLVINTPASGGNGIGTAAPTIADQGYVGRVFHGGVFQATFHFDPTLVNAANGWPSFWGEAIEHFENPQQDHPPGTDGGFEHFAEDNFFEYEFSGPSDFWHTSLIDWFGVYSATCETGERTGLTAYCWIQNDGYGTPYDTITDSLPDGGPVDWTQWHTVTQLWIPGNAANGEVGTVQNFLDGVPAVSGVGAYYPLSKTGWNDQVPYTFANLDDGDNPAVFSVLDQDHLMLILGSGPGEPFYVGSVKVWQLPGCAQ